MPIGMTKFTIDTNAPQTVIGDKDTYFTGSITQYNTEEENIPGLQSNKVRIRSITVISTERLRYRLLLFNTDGFADTSNIDNDTFIIHQDFDLPNHGLQIASANQYYMSVEGLNILYEDKDRTYELHVALQNLSSTAKTSAVGGGYIVIKFTYQDAQFE